MTPTIQQLFTPFQLGVAAAVFFTMPTLPASSVLKNGRVRLTNTSAGPVTATLYAAAAATPSAAANCFLSSVSVPANSSMDVDVPSLGAGDTLRGLAGSGAVITVHELGGVIFS